MSSQQIPETLPVAAATTTSKVTDEKNELNMWVSTYNGTVYLHIQQKYDAPEKKKQSYCFLTPENGVKLSAILGHALQNPKDFDEKLVGMRGKIIRVLFKRNVILKNTACLYVYDPKVDVFYSRVTLIDVEAFQKCFNKMYSAVRSAVGKRLID